MLTLRRSAAVLLSLLIAACTSQQYYEGLKAGHRASCLEYPEAEYDDCVDETKTSYDEYKNQREDIIGK